MTCQSTNTFCIDFILFFFSREDSPDRRAAGPDAPACSEPGPSQHPCGDPDASQHGFEDSKVEASQPCHVDEPAVPKPELSKQITTENGSHEAKPPAEGDHKGELDLLTVEARS